MNRLVLLVLVLACAGCAPVRGRGLTWVETVTEPPKPDVDHRAFWVNRARDVGDCVVNPGSHVTLSGRIIRSGFSVSTTLAAAEWRYGVTLLAADGTTLAHFPSQAGAVYVVRVTRAHGGFGGTNHDGSRHLYDKVARVLIHATCVPATD